MIFEIRDTVCQNRKEGKLLITVSLPFFDQTFVHESVIHKDVAPSFFISILNRLLQACT